MQLQSNHSSKKLRIYQRLKLTNKSCHNCDNWQGRYAFRFNEGLSRCILRRTTLVCIGLLGFYAWVASILRLILTFKGYQWFGRNVNKIGAVLVFLTAFSLVFVANHALWA